MSQEYDWVTFDDDEEVIWSGSPRVASVLKTALFFFLLAGAGVVAVVQFGYGNIAYAAGGVVLSVGLTILSYLGVRNTDYVLTNKRLYRKSGVLSEQTESAQLHKIQNTSLSKDIIGSFRGFGTVSISTAAGAGDIKIRNINDPSELKRLLKDETAKAVPDEQDTQPVGQGDVSFEELQAEIEEFRTNISLINDELGGD